VPVSSFFPAGRAEKKPGSREPGRDGPQSCQTLLNHPGVLCVDLKTNVVVPQNLGIEIPGGDVMAPQMGIFDHEADLIQTVRKGFADVAPQTAVLIGDHQREITVLFPSSGSAGHGGHAGVRIGRVIIVKDHPGPVVFLRLAGQVRLTDDGQQILIVGQQTPR